MPGSIYTVLQSLALTGSCVRNPLGVNPWECPAHQQVTSPELSPPFRQVCAQSCCCQSLGWPGMAKFGSIQTKAWLYPNYSGGSLAPGADSPWDCISLLGSGLGAEAALLYSLQAACGCCSPASSHPTHTDGPRGREHKTLPCYRRFPKLMSMPTDSKY